VNRLAREPGARDQPGDDGVRVPHLARAQLVAAPNRSRDERHELQHPSPAVGIIADAAWTRDGFCDVRDPAVAPAAYLVTEEPETTQGSRADRTFGDDAALGAIAPHRRLLDHEPSFRHAHLERRVVEVAAISPFEPGRDCLEDLSVQADEVAARTKRQPIEIHAEVVSRPCP
jgi:hypothetical protein